jgi:uncharacterized membrane protein (UPF0136 family)
MFKSPDWLAVAFTMLAAVGGLLGYLVRSMDKRQRISWPLAVVKFLTSGFVGFLVLLACRSSGVTDEWTGVVVGVSGWLGADVTIRIIESWVRTKLGIDLRPADKPLQERKDDQA